MAPRRRHIVRLRSQALWDRLTLMQRSQNWLANQMGISRSYLSTLVNRGQAPSGRMRRRMMRLLGIEDFNELFYIEHPAE